MWGKIFVIGFLCFASLTSFSQEEKARKIVETLCSDAFYGRGYVNDGMNIAANFVRDEFKEIGLKPFVNDTSYFQTFSYPVNVFPDTLEFKVNDKHLKPGVDFLIDEASGSFQGELLPVFIGPVHFTKKKLFTEAYNEIVSGNKNAFFVDLESVDEKERPQMMHQLRVLSKQAPVIFIQTAKFTWSVAGEQFDYPIIYVKPGLIDRNSNLYLQVNATLNPQFITKNVIGFLPSQKENADTLVFSAHFDHLGMMGTYPEKTIFPGGNDNASGTSMLITMADYFTKNPSDYNIIFMAFAGEEAGLFGSVNMVNSKDIDLSTIKFLINLDIMGSGEEGVTVVNGSIYQDEFNKLVSINNEKKYLTQIKSRGEAANSDHYYFYKAGVPSIFIYTMGPNKNYHDVFDTYDALSFAAYNNIVQLLIDFVGKL
ncbi:MAG: M28 family peptidase [Brumimicrobium sp.]|nr:M28 family peptidase [Brumimicrobium sp.]